MNWVDIAIIVVLVLLAFFGLRQGLVRTVALLVGIVFGVVLAGQWDKVLASRLFPEAAWGQIVSFAVILIAILIASSIVGRILQQVLRFMMLGWLDKLAGAAFGLLVGIFLIGGLLAVAAKAGEIPIVGQPLGGVKGAIQDSSLAQLITDQIPLVRGLLPEEFDQALDIIYPD
jgi:membrane protein required for colicin V production